MNYTIYSSNENIEIRYYCYNNSYQVYIDGKFVESFDGWDKRDMVEMEKYC